MLFSFLFHTFELDYVLVESAGQDWHSWYNASSYCSTRLNTQLGTFWNYNPDIAVSYFTLADTNGLNHNSVPCWIGCYQIDGTSTQANNFRWQEKDASFNLSRKHYNFNNVSHPCCYYYPFNSDARVGDWFCDNEAKLIGHNNIGYEVAYCWLCNKPERLNYTISIKTGPNSNAGTSDYVYFRIQGNIQNTTDDNDTWTEWFTLNQLTDSDTTYIREKELKYVGTAEKMIILLQSSDGIQLRTIEVDEKSYTSSSGIWLDYDDGKQIVYIKQQKRNHKRFFYSAF